MRILVVQESDWLRRNPHQQHQMLERLSAQGHDIRVLDYPIRWRDEGRGLFAPRRVYRGVTKVVPGASVTVVRSAALRISGLGKLSWLATNTVEIARALRIFKPDVVVILGLSNGLVALTMARAAGVPVVVHLIDALHTLVEPKALRPIARWVEKRLLRNAGRVIVINKALSSYAECLGARPERMERIPTGVDLDRFGPHVDGSAVRDEYGIAPGEHVLLFIGWLYDFSGLRELALTMAEHPELAQGMRLLVVGDGDLMAELTRIRDDKLGDQLILAGQQPATRMPEFVAAADICLLPAYVNETMAHIVPAKIYDYLAGGKPVLASPLPGLMQEFGDDAGICSIKGPQVLLNRAAQLFDDPVRLTAMGTAARHTSEVNGAWEDVTARYMDILAATVRPREGAVQNLRGGTLITNLVPTKQQFAERIPQQYQRYAGIGPYYLPVFGRMYSKRLHDCLAAVRQHVQGPAAILDAGCGLGLATAALADMYPQAEVFGLDMYSEDVLQHAGNLMPGSKRVQFVSGSIEQAPFKDGRFDLVTAFDMLEHVPHPEVALDELYRLLSADGFLIVSVPIESPLLRGLRYVALAGGRRGNIRPHWAGAYHNLASFEAGWRKRFATVETFYTPLRFGPRWLNYDVVLVGRRRPRQASPASADQDSSG